MNSVRDVAAIAAGVVILSLLAAWIHGGGGETVRPPLPQVPENRMEPVLPPAVRVTPVTAPKPPPPDTTALGLEWLARAQHPDGHWDHSPARTGLALLAFLSAGQTHKHGEYRRTVRNGLKVLKQIQHPDGTFAFPDAPRSALDHAIATMAMAEAYALTSSPLFKQSAQQGIAVLQALDPQGARETTWAVLALEQARHGGLRVDRERIRNLGERYTPTGAIRLQDPAGQMMGLLGNVLAGGESTDDRHREIEADGVLALAGRFTDPEFNYFGSWLSRVLDSRSSGTWTVQVRALAGSRQEADGSFAPAGPRAGELGRTGTTALMTAATAMTFWSGDQRIR